MIIHKSQWVLSSADLFLLLQAKIAVMEHEKLTFVTEWVETTVWIWQRYMPCDMWRERNKCLLEKTEHKNSFIFQDFRRIFKDFFPYVEGNFKVIISSVLGQYSHRISEQKLLMKGQSWDEKYCEWVFIQPSFWVFVKYFCIYILEFQLQLA